MIARFFRGWLSVPSGAISIGEHFLQLDMQPSSMLLFKIILTVITIVGV